ncbi:MAG TPA: DUF2804 domain-containing protein [Marmoricola sp.]|nr:DUF2804 domain-containing protein [Marmoricola sp.]
MLPEITQPVDLCDGRGRLNPRAIGWTRTPLHRPNLRGWGRTKRWEYWGLVTDTHVVGLTVSSLDYAGVEAVYVLDRASRREVVHEATVPLARGVRLAPRVGWGASRVSAGRLRIELAEVDGGTRLQVSAPGVELDALAGRPPGHESLGVVVPWSDRLFQYTVKDVARPLSGSLTVAGTSYDATGWAVLDHGRGRWPYSLTWNWAAGSGTVDGEVRGIQLGGKWTEGTGSTENALLVGTRLHKLHDEVTWDYDSSDWLRPWRIHGDRLDVTFTPFHERAAKTNLLVVASETHQCFGQFTGWAVDDAGVRVSLDGLTGWAEEARNRW